MAAAFLLGNLRDARAGAARPRRSSLGGAAIVVYNDPDPRAGELVFIPVLFAIAWLAGFALRERAEQAEAAEERATQAEREREAAARIAVAEERARIARELHDIVAHAVSVMVLQVGAVRHRLPDGARRGRGGAQRRRAGRPHGARRDAPPARRDAQRRRRPRARAAARARRPRRRCWTRSAARASPSSCTSRASRSPLPRAIDLSAYRIVQEGLTNALKHARAEPRRRDRPLRARRAADRGARRRRRAAATSDGLGHGLVGIRERVKIYGGEMTAGAATGGGFVLRTRLPLGGERP